MPYNDDQIANMAIGHLSISVIIGNLATENSAEAIAVRRYFDSCRDTLLEIKPWAFTTVRWTLAESAMATTDPYYGHWAKRYVFPADCARPDQIINPAYRLPPTEAHKIPYKIIKANDGTGGKYILCDQANAVLEGNLAGPDTAEYDATFAEIHSLFIAMRAAPQLRVSGQIIQNVVNQWRDWLAEAGAQNDALGQQDPEPESQYQTVRG